MDIFFTLIKVILVLIITILLANVSLKILNKEMKKNNKIINIIERTQLGNNSSINVVEICGEYYLLSSTENDNEILKKLNKEDIEKIINEDKKTKEEIEIKYKTFVDLIKRRKRVE